MRFLFLCIGLSVSEVTAYKLESGVKSRVGYPVLIRVHSVGLLIG